MLRRAKPASYRLAVLRLLWTEQAEDDLAQIIAFISLDSQAAAQRLKERIERSVTPASEHPYMFRPGRVPGTREIVAHPNYIVVYRVAAEHIEVTAVVHARQEYPPDDEP